MRFSRFALLPTLAVLMACRGDGAERGRNPVFASEEGRGEPVDSGAVRSHASEPWRELFDGATLEGWERTPFGGEGDVEVLDGAIVLEMGSPLTGIHWSDASALPTSDYEIEVVAARVFGTDFFCGLTFPVFDSHASLILGGWGGALTGISCLDRQDASLNETRTFQSYVQGREYTARVRVTEERIVAWLDGEEIVNVSIVGRSVEVRSEVLASRPLGVACFTSKARLLAVRVRGVGE
jgi:hypothetical protein